MRARIYAVYIVNEKLFLLQNATCMGDIKMGCTYIFEIFL